MLIPWPHISIGSYRRYWYQHHSADFAKPATGLRKIPPDTNLVILCCFPSNVTQALVVPVRPSSRAGLLSDIVVTEWLWLWFCVFVLSFFETFTSARSFHSVTLCGELAVIFYCSSPRVGGGNSVGVKSDHRHIWVGKGFLEPLKYVCRNQLQQTLSCHIVWLSETEWEMRSCQAVSIQVFVLFVI